MVQKAYVQRASSINATTKPEKKRELVSVEIQRPKHCVKHVSIE